ncbi:hypothetical protein ACHAW5_000251 [Stephanodiscus triporus]|uniref:Chalcone isomerase domain-containing protein n=1 Tax=Stephanodiscus triporus TaxID=2934178 RepID=A0ABD3NB76_9STRA
MPNLFGIQILHTLDCPIETIVRAATIAFVVINRIIGTSRIAISSLVLTVIAGNTTSDWGGLSGIPLVINSNDVITRFGGCAFTRFGGCAFTADSSAVWEFFRFGDQSTVGVCSSVLYLDPSSIDNDATLFRSDAETPMALEIHYHKPARAVDLKWATSSFIEANLLPDEKISDLPASMQRSISQYNDLYRNIRSGDRYSLTYLPGIGLRLSLNDEILGTIGTEMPGAERRELAKLIYSVWFGQIAPFSVSMRDELLTPLSRPRHDAMEAFVDATFATSRHHPDHGLLRALLGAVDDVYHDTTLRGTVFALDQEIAVDDD